MSKDNPRIAVLGFAIECNRFSPVSTKEDFETKKKEYQKIFLQ